ncbi:hypothetical protein [Methylobacterium sp. V23]|uniref:hypothetical protein n=1 Tax=Methylobacterium sp. V23 TaxID=2044878 RepID=UPI000CDA58AE|nr:hypothetical protein [Methylobacterium sp. V23]POR40928.1 hypothetical protein CRT23_21465 [Methylobacterium sp. V23]
MITTIKAHGRTRRDTAALVVHLEKTEFGQVVDIIRIAGSPASDMAGAFADFERIRDGSRATIALQHLPLSPGRPWTAAERDTAVNRILAALGAEHHGYVLVAHRNKPRARGEAGDEHFHLVIAHVGPGLRALNLSYSYATLEAVRASLEVDFSEPLTPSRRSPAIAARLRRGGREAVAERVEAAALVQSELPRSGLTSRIHARLERLGIAAPLVRARVISAYAMDRAGFEGALSEAGLSCIPGDQVAGAWVVRQGDVLVGALDRLVARPRAVMAARMRSLVSCVGETADPRLAPVEAAQREGDRDAEPIPAPVVPIVDGMAISQPPRSDAPSPLTQWRARFVQDLALEQGALKRAQQRSSVPTSRWHKEEEARAERRTARTERARAAALVQDLEASQAPPGILTRWFGAKKRPDPHPELAAARAALAHASEREANAETKLESLPDLVAHEAADYARRMRIEDEASKTAERDAENQIAFFEDALIVLDYEPWRAAIGIEAIRDGVRRLRRAARLTAQSHPHNDPTPVDGLEASLRWIPRVV